MAGYSFYDLCAFFLIYSVLGWCTEVCFCTVETGHFVNRGFLNGPVCPIYGFGMLLVILSLTPLGNGVLVLFFGGMVLTSLIELVGGWALKKVFHTSWWDYSDQPFNLGGYICLKFSLLWGIGVVLVMRVIHPIVTTVVHWVPHVLGVVLLGVGAALFLCDTIVTVMAIAKLQRSLGHISEVTRMLREGSDALAKNLGNTALAGAEKLDAAKDQLDAAKDQLGAAWEQYGEKSAAQKAESEAKAAAQRAENAAKLDLLRAEILDQRNAITNRLMKAFPQMKDMRDNAALEKLKEWSKGGK